LLNLPSAHDLTLYIEMVIYFAYNLIILVNVKRLQIAFTAEYRHRHLYLYIENKVKGMKKEKESIFIYKYAYFRCYEYH